MRTKITSLRPHYMVEIFRDKDPTDPLDMDLQGVIHHGYRERGVLSSRKESGEAVRLAYALATKTLDEFFEEGGQLPSRYLPETEEVDWFDLSGRLREIPPTLAGYAVHPSAPHPLKEVAHNTSLLRKFGVPETPENIYREDMPKELITAMTKHLLSEVVFVEAVTACGDSYGTHYIWAEKADIVDKWGVHPDNARTQFDGWVEEFKNYLDGAVWGFVVDYVECDDPTDPDAPRYVEPGLESCSDIIGADAKSVIDTMAMHWFGLEQPTSDITDAVLSALGAHMSPITVYVPIQDS